mgnify:CR=1 FL=1|jgi:hypothetical protein
MAWANVNNVTTTHLDSATDDPSQARVELYNALIELRAVINGRNTASGIAPLDANSLIPGANLPNTFSTTTSNNLVLQPDTGRVAVQDILNLTPLTVAQLNALTAIEGDVAYCSDGNSGTECVAVYNGTDWKVVALGATISV